MFNTQKEWEEALASKVKISVEKIPIFKMIEVEICSADIYSSEAVFRFPLKEWYSNQFGNIEGAVTAAFMEIACGTVSNTLCGETDSVVTDLNIAFIRALHYKEDILVRVRLVKEGKAVIRTHGEIYDGKSGELAVTAECSAFRV